jgi:hypothetical protein
MKFNNMNAQCMRIQLLFLDLLFVYKIIIILCLHILMIFFFFSENQDRFICPNNMCCRTYKFKRNLSSHLKLECGGQKGFNCSICPKAFSQKVILKKHLAQIHNCIE